MMKLMVGLATCGLTAALLPPDTGLIRGVEGTTVRLGPAEAKVAGCEVAEPGTYEVKVGDLIELEYTFPVVPAAIPKKVACEAARSRAVVKSRLGVRSVTTPGKLGSKKIAFYFEAKKPGESKVTLSIDGVEYAYEFEVAK